MHSFLCGLDYFYAVNTMIQSATAIFACLLNVLGMASAPYPVIQFNNDLLSENNALGLTNQYTKVITFHEGWRGDRLQPKDVRTTAHEFTRYLLLIKYPEYQQNARYDEKVETLQRECE